MSFWMLADTEPQAAEENQRPTGCPPRLSVEALLSVEAMQWEFLDEVNLDEIFQRTFKVLQSLLCSDEGQVSSGISCGIGGVAHRSRAGRRDEAVTGVESCSVCCFSGCCSEWVPKVGLAETSETSWWKFSMLRQPQVTQPLPRQRTLTPEQRAKAVCQKIRVGDVSRAKSVPHRRNVGSRNTGNVA